MRRTCFAIATLLLLSFMPTARAESGAQAHDSQAQKAASESSICDSLAVRIAGSAVLVGSLALLGRLKKPAEMIGGVIADKVGESLAPVACVFVTDKFSPQIGYDKLPTKSLAELGIDAGSKFSGYNVLTVPVSPDFSKLAYPTSPTLKFEPSFGLGPLPTNPAPTSFELLKKKFQADQQSRAKLEDFAKFSLSDIARPNPFLAPKTNSSPSNPSPPPASTPEVKWDLALCPAGQYYSLAQQRCTVANPFIQPRKPY